MDDVGLKINIDVPDNVSRILNTIRGAGYEAFVVGGCIRDRLLGRDPEDWDITTSALPEQVKTLFHATVDTGIEHGTVMVIMGGKGYEVTTYRIDGEYRDGRHPDSVEFTPDLAEDLKRRDFTINAFAYDPDKGLVDLFGGLEDLRGRIIRAVGDPRQRFSEDALRIMRAVRFSAQLSFGIDRETESAISEFAPRLEMVSRERKRVEFEKTLYSDNPECINRFAQLGLAPYIVPDFSGKCFREQSMPVLKAVENGKDAAGKVLRLAAFFSALTADECSNVMRQMTFDNRSRDLVAGILRYRGGSPETQGGLPEDPAGIRRMLKETGQELFELLIGFDRACGEDVRKTLRTFEEIILNKDPFTVSMLKVSGDDLIREGVPAGIQIGTMLNRLLDMVIEDPGLNDKEILLKFVRGEK